MKKGLLSILAVFTALSLSYAQNNKADNIIGKYSSIQSGEEYKVEVTKNSNGTYKAQIYWVSNTNDPKTGAKRLDSKNPDKSLRNTPCDRIVLFNGLKYNSEKQQWGDTKIYDPQRGLKANCTATFANDNTLKIKGTVLGIGETVTWTRVN